MLYWAHTPCLSLLIVQDGRVRAYMERWVLKNISAVPIFDCSAMVRLQCRQPRRVREAEGEVLRAFKREVMEQRAIIAKALSEVSAFGKNNNAK